MRKTIILTMTFGVILALSIPNVLAVSLEIRQDTYTYRMPVTRSVTVETFVIARREQSSRNSYVEIDDKNSAKNHAECTSVIHFRFDSFAITPDQRRILLGGLVGCTKVPLLVTGYTCPLGPDAHNQALSLQRAKAVATLLRMHGYHVATVRGRGPQDCVTNDPGQYRLNRRVVVQVDPSR